MKTTISKNFLASLALGTAILVGYASPGFTQTPYSDSADHYSFTLPDGWKEIPKSVIDQYIDEVVRQTQGQRIEYAAGFQLSEKDYFQYPYILIQEHDVNTPSYLQIEKVFSNSGFQNSVKQKTEEYSELLTNATLEKPFFDKERNIIFMNIQADVANIGKINGLMAMFLGKQGITQLNFYALESEYSRWLPVFNSMTDSFRYETAYAYNLAEAVKNDSPSFFENAAKEGLLGAIFGGIIGVTAASVGWSLRKKKGKDSP